MVIAITSAGCSTASHATVQVGGSETCAETAAGEWYCWGIRGPSPGTVQRAVSVEPVFRLEAGVFQACGLSSSGALLCSWDLGGRPGQEASAKDCTGFMCLYHLPDAISGYTGVSTGYYHVCALDSEKRAYCWGQNGMGQLGLGWRAPDSVGSGGERVGVPSPVAASERWRAISAGEMYTCALTVSHEAYCWGYNQSGELGRDTAMTYCSGALPQPNASCSVDRPIKVDTPIRFRTISAGMRLTCGISLEGKVYCWGSNYRCELGRCGAEDSPVPTAIPFPGEAIQVDAGYWFACAVATDHRAYCWGNNVSGQLGSLVTDDAGGCFKGGRCSPVPTEVSGGHLWRSVSAGENHACGVTLEDEIYCWGSRARGGLGSDAGDEICVNHSDTWKDEPCSSSPVRIALPPGPRRQ